MDLHEDVNMSFLSAVFITDFDFYHQGTNHYEQIQTYMIVWYTFFFPRQKY